MFSGTVSDYLFIYVFLLFPEVQKCYVFRHCARLLVYLCISIISRSPEMLFSGTVSDYLFIYVFLLFPEVQKCHVFRHCQIICVFMYFYYFQKSRNVMFTGTVPDYLFIYVFLLFPESILFMFSGTVHFARQVSESLYHDTIDTMDTIVL